ncbi:MAG: hypothetical protein AB7K09_06720 [Planctomycetota bacterium]
MTPPRLIVLLDDKSYGLEQVRRAIPRDMVDRVELRHIDRWSVWQADPPDAFVVLLDYYLDKDGLEGVDVVGQIRATHLIGFSSVLRCSRSICELAGQSGNFRSAHAVQKLDGGLNPRLADVMIEVLNDDADDEG